MENKEKVLEGIRQSSYKISQLEAELASTKEQLNALKSELDKADTVEVAADGAILVEGEKGHCLTGVGEICSTCVVKSNAVKYLASYATKEQAQDEVLRREIDCYIRRRACELNDNHNWKRNVTRVQSCIFIENIKNNCKFSGRYFNKDSDTNMKYYFNDYNHSRAVAEELNAKYSPEIIKRLYYAQ